MLDAHEPTRASGGGLALHLSAVLPVPHDVALHLHQLGELLAARTPDAVEVPALDLCVPLVDFGPVAEEFAPAVAQALDIAALHVQGPAACTVIGGTLLAGATEFAARIDIDLHVLVAAMRDELLMATAPYAPKRDIRAWMPHVTVLRAAAGTTLPDRLLDQAMQPERAAWIAPHVELVARIHGPLGDHARRLHVASFGDVRVRVDR